MRSTLLLVALLAGCTLASVNEPQRRGFAQVSIGHLENGEPSVKVYSLDSAHHFRTQQLVGARTLTLKAGTYNAEIDCFRPGAYALVDISFNFRFTVEADRAYVLDCAPSGQGQNQDNGFVLRTSPN